MEEDYDTLPDGVTEVQIACSCGSRRGNSHADLNRVICIACGRLFSGTPSTRPRPVR